MLNKHYSVISLRFNSICLFVVGLLLISPIFALLPKASTIINLFLTLIIIIRQKRIKRPQFFFIILGVVLLTSLIPAIYNVDIQFIFISYFFITAIFIVLQCDRYDILMFVDFSTNFLLVVIWASLFGFLYAFIGGSPIFTFDNPNGIPNEVFLTTMTNSRWGNIIRPSGIYDEPGAFSFFICSIAMLRKLFNLTEKKTWLLLIFGLITFSVAHVLYLLFHVLSDKNLIKFSISKLIIFLLGILLVFFISITPLWDAVDMIFLSRFKNSGTGLFPGDNRSDLFFNTWNYIYDNPIVTWFGMPLNTDFELIASQYGNLGANMLMNLLRWGIFASWPYYLILLIFILNSFKSRMHLIFVGFVLMLVQREFIYVVSYSMMIVLVLRVLYYNLENE